MATKGRQAAPKGGRKKKKKEKTVEEAAYYAIAHPTRVEILAYLNEGPRSPTQLAQLMDMKLSETEHHVVELLAVGSIELAFVKEGTGNLKEHFYRAVKIPFYTDEEMWALPLEVRQKIYGLILQASMAEALAAFNARKMSNDPRAWMAWRWFNVDAQGRNDLADEKARSWARCREIVVESANRVSRSKEQLVSMLVTSFCYERCRSAEAFRTDWDTTKRRVGEKTLATKGRQAAPRGGRKKKKKEKTVEEAAYYAIAHPTRVEILAYLNEGPRSPTQLAGLMNMKLSTIEHHVLELLAVGSIELAFVKEGTGNLKEHFYRAVKIPFYTDQEMWALPLEVRQKIYGLILQASMAEALAAFNARKMSNDPRAWMAWRWFNVDAQGRNDLADEKARSWARCREIVVESANRVSRSKEQLVSMLVTSFCYERCRSTEASPATLQARSDTSASFVRENS